MRALHGRGTMPLHKLLPIFTLITLMSLTSTGFTDSESLSIDFSSDLSKSEINAVLNIAKKQNAGKVISIIHQTEHAEKTYKVKVINGSGRLQTYYINQSITQMKP